MPDPGEQRSPEAVAKALLFANGLRKSIATAGRRWTQWPGGANQLPRVIAVLDRIQARIQQPPAGEDTASALGTAIADLRAVLEWSTYQSAALATARALLVARRTRSFVDRFGLLEATAPPVASLEDAEDALIENVRTKNGYMTAIAERHAHLDLPRPLVSAESLARVPQAKPGRLALIQRLTRSAKKPSRP
jgi:hypothetical protein